MNSYRIIESKLELFIKRFYNNEILKGIILFVGLGLLYFLFTLLIEHFFWLNTFFRTFLFWCFIIVEGVLLYLFVCIPVFKLFKFKEGINHEDAAIIIGKHFPEINDKLLNVVQLNNNFDQSDLLIASIKQKATELKPFPFKFAVNYRSVLPYLKYILPSLLILLAIYLTGNFNWFKDSYKRVINHNIAFEPPAPFQFFILNKDLNAIEGKDFKLLIKTAGDIFPEDANIIYNNESYFLKKTGIGEFEYIFSQLDRNIKFYLNSNKVSSKEYQLTVLNTPSLTNFEMVVDYPNYINKQNDVFKSSGNAIVPEGTKVSWNLKTKFTDKVSLIFNDTLQFNSNSSNNFSLSKVLYNDFNYAISTSNSKLKDYEYLSFNIDVIKDAYPDFNIQVKKDSVDLQALHFFGQANDDYGFTKLQLVYYETDNESVKSSISIPFSSTNFTEFFISFPNQLNLISGKSYQLYFEVFDNDKLHNYKSKRSSIFNYRKRTEEEEKDKQLKDQFNTISDFNKVLKSLNKQDNKLKSLSKSSKEKGSLNFNEKKNLASILEKQKQQDAMMKNFNNRLKNNLKSIKQENKAEDNLKKDLQQRLQDNEDQLKNNEDLIKELENLQDKINDEELIKKLDDIAKQNKNNKRSLSQILELTKRFYVERKLDKLANDLNSLAKDQKKLSNENNNTKEQQQQINSKFSDFQKQYDELEKDNKVLKKPFDISRDKLDEQDVNDEQNKALKHLDSTNLDNKRAKQHQKNAAKKMNQMAKKMQNNAQSMSGDQIQEDVAMLRQILDNLVLFSFDEEALMNNFKVIDENQNSFAKLLKQQNNLQEYFEHIDDSLFALSLRQPKLSEKVNKHISDVYFNIDKSLSNLAENLLPQAISNQQFAITASNNLSDLLSDILDNMIQNMSMSAGQGSQSDMQLPDIIMSQEQLNKMMEEGLKQSQQGKKKDGKNGEKQGEKDGENKGDKKQGNNGEGLEEELNGMLFKIYQQQQELRQALNDKITKEGLQSTGSALTRKMEEIEMELLNKGFTNQTLSKMMELKHQLLKLENAELEQGKDTKRESITNNSKYNNNTTNQTPTAKQYFNTTEILDKQLLPLHQIYRNKVQEYFKAQ